MAALIRVTLAAGLLVVVPARADDVDRWRPYIAEASTRFGVPVAWIERVMRVESRGRTQLGGRPIRSPKGAMGLMQLMPRTWAEMRMSLTLGVDPDDPHDNILAGTFYLRLMYDRFGYPGCFAAYNAGPGRYAAWIAGTARLPDETVAYLGAVGAGGKIVAPARAIAALPPGLFVARSATPKPGANEPYQSSPTGLFVIRKEGQ